MKSDLKKELHLLIDTIDDEPTLFLLKEDLAAYTVENNIEGLTHEQLKTLDTAIEEADNENGLQDWNSFKSELMNKWREK